MDGQADELGHAGSGSPPSVHVTWRAIGIATAVLAALWAFDALVLHTDLLASIGGLPATSPYYAVFLPNVQAGAIVFVLAAAAFVRGAPRLCDPLLTTRRAFAFALLASAVLLPFALFLVRKMPADLGSGFSIYRQDEFVHDAERIGDYGAFLRHYVENMPGLSLHGRHFPPGHATLLYLVRCTLGPDDLAAGIVVLAIAAIGVLCAWRGLCELAGEAAARQGACLLLAVPALLDFTCTSMDAVFFAIATCAWWLSLRAARTGRALDAVVAGAVLFAATFFSFSALPLGLVIALHALLAGRDRPSSALRRLLVIGTTWAACAWALYLATGFPIWSCFLRANELGREFMGHIMSTRAHVGWLNVTYGNAAAYLIGAGAGLVTAVALALRSRAVRRSPWTIASLATLAILAAGHMHWMETERIWLYTLPWLAVIAVSAHTLDPASLRRLLVAGLAQALIMEIVLFTLW